jgi:hypothetical protein
MDYPYPPQKKSELVLIAVSPMRWQLKLIDVIELYLICVNVKSGQEKLEHRFCSTHLHSSYLPLYASPYFQLSLVFWLGLL